MKKKTKYTKGKIGKIGPAVKDFLPPPDKLVLRESNMKVVSSLKSTRRDDAS